MTNDKVNVGEREDVVLLQEEVQKITANIQVMQFLISIHLTFINVIS